ncbi:MAG: hypothetical protein EXR11_01395 [Rhodospirillaceae bacterium]|nr:hypothetical protein [Rhodospirillaceae bacterium]
MIRALVTLTLGVSIMATVPAWAQSDPTPTAPAAKEKKVCRTSMDTGTRIGKQRVCRTDKEWAQIDNNNKDVVDEMVKFKGFTDPAAAAGTAQPK